MDQISEAVQAARYNEAVVVNVEDEEGVRRELVLVATIDAENGGVIWQNAAASDDDKKDDIGIRRHLRTKKWVLPMLNDETRNAMYQGAIQKACKEAVAKHQSATSKSGGTFHALDIGSGTGLLAMMTSKYSKEVLKKRGDEETNVEVVSLEMASAMARLARQTVTSNGFTKADIVIREEHSCEMKTTPPQNGKQLKAMLCTSELLESGLLGEGILPALRDAWNRHLHPDAIMVPQRARVYAQLLDSNELIRSYAGPPTTTKDLGKDSPGLRLSTSIDGSGSLLGDVSGVLLPIHSGSLFQDGKTRVLSEPIMVMDFDFSSRVAMPDLMGRSRSHSLVAKASGAAQAVLFWWELDLWDGLTYSTEVGKQPWQDHWQQCVYIFTNESLVIPVEEGKAVSLTCHHTDTNISFSVDDGIKDWSEPKRAKTVASKPQLSPLRSSILADKSRILTIHKSIASVLSTIGTDSLVLDISDFSLCGVLAALSGAKCVVSLESSSCGQEIPMMSARVAQIGNGLPLDGATFEILQCHAEQLTLEVLGGPTQLVVAEPYYEMLEGWHLQECINYYFLLKSLQNRGLLATGHVSIPSHARVMGCAIQSDSIYNAYKGCGDRHHIGKQDSTAVCGFDHAIVNSMGARYHEYDLSIPIWQYQNTELTDAFEIVKLDYNQLVIDGNGEWAKAPFSLNTSDATCHGLLLWIEYYYPSADTEQSETISTKLFQYNQVVRLMETPIPVEGDSMLHCRMTIGKNAIVNHEIHAIELTVTKNV